MRDALPLRERVPLAPMTTLGVGGGARWLLEVSTVEQVEAGCRWAEAGRVPLFVLAGGSNVVVADAGFDGLVLHVVLRGLRFEALDGGRVRVHAGAGESWDGFVAAMVARGLAGVECLSGIPGTVGATPIQNVGAYGQEVAQVVEAVEAWDRVERQVVHIPRADCGFGYRTSRFKGTDAGRYIVLGVTFMLAPGPPTVSYPDLVSWLARATTGASSPTPSLALVREAVLAVRRGKGMVIDPADPDTRSVGSFFTNPIVPEATVARIAGLTGDAIPAFPAGPGQVKLSAAWLLERAGFGRGFGQGTVGLSTKHTLAVVNRGGATAADVVGFAAALSGQVMDRFGVRLVPEPLLVGFDN